MCALLMLSNKSIDSEWGLLSQNYSKWKQCSCTQLSQWKNTIADCHKIRESFSKYRNISCYEFNFKALHTLLPLNYYDCVFINDSFMGTCGYFELVSFLMRLFCSCKNNARCLFQFCCRGNKMTETYLCYLEDTLKQQ